MSTKPLSEDLGCLEDHWKLVAADRDAARAGDRLDEQAVRGHLVAYLFIVARWSAHLDVWRHTGPAAELDPGIACLGDAG
jgi:hypothetical protein